MANTPEGKIKERVRNLLNRAKDNGVPLYYFFPPSNGYGTAGAPDIVGSCRGKFFGIETKVPGRKPTLLQQRAAEKILESNGVHFLIYGTDDDYLRLELFLYHGEIHP